MVKLKFGNNGALHDEICRFRHTWFRDVPRWQLCGRTTSRPLRMPGCLQCTVSIRILWHLLKECKTLKKTWVLQMQNESKKKNKKKSTSVTGADGSIAAGVTMLAIGDTSALFPRRGLASRNKNGLLLEGSAVKGFFDKTALGARFGEHIKGLLFVSGTVFLSRAPVSVWRKWVMVTGIAGSVVAEPSSFLAGDNGGLVVLWSTEAGTEAAGDPPHSRVGAKVSSPFTWMNKTRKASRCL